MWRKYPPNVVRVGIRDDILGELVITERSMEFYEGYHAGGRISYRGERLQIIFGPSPRDAQNYYGAESYPPPLRRCRTKRARDYWARQKEQQ